MSERKSANLRVDLVRSIDSISNGVTGILVHQDIKTPNQQIQLIVDPPFGSLRTGGGSTKADLSR